MRFDVTGDMAIKTLCRWAHQAAVSVDPGPEDWWVGPRMGAAIPGVPSRS